MDPVLDAALDAVARAVAIFPVNAATKRPATPHGFLDATKDPDVCTGWWGGPYRGCGIGAATGATSDVWALDIDRQHGGFASLSDLELRHGRLPETTTASTPSGGLHLWFRHPGIPVKSTMSVLGPGLDVRGDRSCCTMPPTRRPDGRGYAWLRDWSALTDAPAWLVALVREPDRPPIVAAPRRPAPTGGTRYGDVALAREAETIRRAAPGTRNTTTNASAYSIGRLVAGGELERGPAEESLVLAAIDAGLPEREARAAVACGLRAGLQLPRSRPEGSR